MSVHVGAAASGRRNVTLHALRAMHARGEPIAMLTAYDATFARIAADAGIDALLVGDSLGMVVQGHASTLPVSLDAMAYHTACVARGLGACAPWLVADLPFGSYANVDAAMQASVALMRAG